MDYKKKYEQALEYMRTVYPTLTGAAKEDVEHHFPELKESKDEKIRKVFRGWIYTQPSSFFDSGVSKEEILAWLEKQGETKLQYNSALEVWKDMRLEVYQQASGNRHEPNYSDDSTKMFSLTDIDEIFEKVAEKQSEQKSTEWSEEDEQNLNGIIDEIEANKNNAPDYDIATYDSFISWLKSIKERQSWKPNDEQIKLLREVQQALLGKDCHNRFVNFMYELKRLREE